MSDRTQTVLVEQDDPCSGWQVGDFACVFSTHKDEVNYSRLILVPCRTDL